jgi:hypothetical protein
MSLPDTPYFYKAFMRKLWVKKKNWVFRQINTHLTSLANKESSHFLLLVPSKTYTGIDIQKFSTFSLFLLSKYSTTWANLQAFLTYFHFYTGSWAFAWNNLRLWSSYICPPVLGMQAWTTMQNSFHYFLICPWTYSKLPHFIGICFLQSQTPFAIKYNC